MYYEQHYPNQLDNFYKMDQFLEIDKLPKLTLEEINNINGYMSNEIEFLFKIYQ